MSVPTALDSLNVAGVPVVPMGDTFWHQGKVFYLDPEIGVDANGREGEGATVDRPMKTLASAFAKCQDESGDKIVLLNDGNTGKSVRLTEALTWSKDNVHLIGTTPAMHVSHRSRITGESGGATFTPLITLSGKGCRFQNFQLFHDYTVDPIALEVTGERNSVVNCHIAGMGHADGGDDAAAASLRLNGGSENVFKGCTIGLDTVARSTTNAEIELIGAAARNVFDGCFISSFADNDGHLFVKIDGSGDIDRYVWFKDTMFYNAVESTATTMLQAMNVHNTCGGMVILQGCRLVGATDWCIANNGNVFSDGPVAASATAGFMIPVTRS